MFKPGAFFIAVENARKSKPPDIPAIDSVYSSHLAPFIKKVDPGSDVVITEAIDFNHQQAARVLVFDFISLPCCLP